MSIGCPWRETSYHHIDEPAGENGENMSDALFGHGAVTFRKRKLPMVRTRIVIPPLHWVQWSVRTMKVWPLVVWALVGVSLWPFALEAATSERSEKKEVLSVHKTVPPIVLMDATRTESDLRRLLRDKNRVEELQLPMVRFSEAQAGSYGFIASRRLALALITQSPDLVLEKTASTSDSYEIHKLADGSGMLVGFIEQTAAPELMAERRGKAFRCALYSQPWEGAVLIAAIPITKLMVDQWPHRVDLRNPNSPVRLEMDVQSMANKKVLGK